VISAHLAGVPVEETVAAFGPTLLIALGAATARLRGLRRRRGMTRRTTASITDAER
jgi:hypothetical protein